MQFDHNARPVPPTTNSRSNRGVIVGTIVAIVGVAMVITSVLTWEDQQRYEPPLTADAPTATMVSAVVTPTKVVCQVGLPQGTVCYFQPTPTPPGICPTTGGLSGYCIYDGPRSLTAESPRRPIGTSPHITHVSLCNGTPVPIGDTANTATWETNAELLSPNGARATPSGVYGLQ